MNSQENADAFYDTTIMPYKGILEEWYVKNDNVYSYFKLIILTILVVVNSNPKIVWKFFKDLPSPPDSLLKYFK